MKRVKIRFNEIKGIGIVYSKLKFRINMNQWKNIKMIDFLLNKESYGHLNLSTDYRLVIFNYKDTGEKKINKSHFIQGIKYHEEEMLDFLKDLENLTAEVKEETKNPAELEDGDLIVSRDYSNWKAGKCSTGGNYGFSAKGHIGKNWYFSTTHDWGCCPNCGRDLFNNDEHECEPKKVDLNNMPYPDDVKYYKITNCKIVISDLDEIIKDFKKNGGERLYQVGIEYLKEYYPELENEIIKKL